MAERDITIKNIYLYLMLTITLIVMIFSGGQLLSAAFKATIFTDTDLDQYAYDVPAKPGDYILGLNEAKNIATEAKRTDLVLSLDNWKKDYEIWLERNKTTPEIRRSRALQSQAANSLPYFVLAAIIFISHGIILNRSQE